MRELASAFSEPGDLVVIALKRALGVGKDRTRDGVQRIRNAQAGVGESLPERIAVAVDIESVLKNSLPSHRRGVGWQHQETDRQ